jgi:hypothetical protein
MVKMDSEGKFWISIWLIVLTAFLALVAAFSYGNREANIEYAKAQSECVARDGSWIPLTDFKALCLQTLTAGEVR